jgi:hypothetical protein
MRSCVGWGRWTTGRHGGMSDHTRPDQQTTQVDREDAGAAHEPDRMPTPEEERSAEQLEVDREAATAYEEAMERGANQQGEGRIT